MSVMWPDISRPREAVWPPKAIEVNRVPVTPGRPLDFNPAAAPLDAGAGLRPGGGHFIDFAGSASTFL